MNSLQNNFCHNNRIHPTNILPSPVHQRAHAHHSPSHPHLGATLQSPIGLNMHVFWTVERNWSTLRKATQKQRKHGNCTQKGLSWRFSSTYHRGIAQKSKSKRKKTVQTFPHCFDYVRTPSTSYLPVIPIYAMLASLTLKTFTEFYTGSPVAIAAKILLTR